jgi:lipopolysaccharide export system permease protein
MWKLNWLMFRSFIGPFLLSFCLLVFILDMQFFWLYLEDLIGKGLEWYVITELLFYASANVVPMALPLSILLSSTMTYGNLAENVELTALKASGASFLRISRPLIFVMILISGFAFYFSNTLWPTANFKMKALLTDIYQAKSTLMISEGKFSNEIDHFGIRATRKDKDTGELYDVLIFDRSGNLNGTTQRYNYRDDVRDYHRDIRAEKGFIRNNNNQSLALILQNGQITEELNPERFEKMTYPFWKIDFEASQLNVDLSSLQFDRTDENSWAQSLEWMSAGQLLVTRDSIIEELPETYESIGKFIHSQNNLSRDSSVVVSSEHDFFLANLTDMEKKRIIKTAKDRTQSQQTFIHRKSSYVEGKIKDLKRIDIFFHRKFTLSIACVILFFIGAPLGAIVKKGGLGMPVLITIILFLFYYLLTKFGEEYAKSEDLSPFLGMWLSSFILGPIGIFFTFKANRDSSIFSWDFYKGLFQKRSRLKNG